MNKVSVLFIILLVVCVPAIGATNTMIDSLQRQIFNLEKKLITREKELIDLDRKANFSYNLAVEAKDRAFKTERELWSEQFGWLAAAVGLLSTLLGLFIGWFGLRKLLESRADKIFKNYLSDRLKGLKDQDITALLSEIEAIAWKSQLKAKKILVLNQTDTVLPNDFTTALKVFEPEIRNINTPKDADQIDYSKYSLIVLENYETNGFWDLSQYKDELVQLADIICGQNAAFIYYGDGRKGYFPQTNINTHLVNFANSPSQLYNNVMNTLKFQDLLSN